MSRIRLLAAGALCGLLVGRGVARDTTASATTDATDATTSADGSSVLECYDDAVATLERICDDYRRIKALELAKLRDLAFLDAYGNIQSVMPVLQSVDRELLRRKITRPEDVVPHKLAVEKVEAEVAQMVELTAKLLAAIEEFKQTLPQEPTAQPEPSHAVTLEEIVAREAYDPNASEDIEETALERSEPYRRLVAQARENPQERAKDVTAAMRAVLQVAVPDPRADDRPSPVVANRSGVQTELRPLDLKTLNYDFGRAVVEEGGEPVEWMFIDTWYTIGPFPNPHRINLSRKFPPETVVNLGATYAGPDGGLLRWEFLQTGNVRCVPHHAQEFAIYYAYTELRFERAMELWIMVGSDDKANVWVNDLPVWISGEQQKSWRANEGLRKVYFREGVNRILFRVENGWKGMSFSLGVQVKR